MPAARKANRGPSAGPANRSALIVAAREVFAEAGLNAPLSAIARRAGVGQGSLYRHFPDRIELAVAVFDENIGDLERLAGRDDATLSDLFDAISEQTMRSTALVELITAERHDPRTTHLNTRMMALVGRMLLRDRQAGRIGAHVDVDDVVLAVGMLGIVLSRTDEPERPNVAERARAMFRRAFAYGPAVTDSTP